MKTKFSQPKTMKTNLLCKIFSIGIHAVIFSRPGLLTLRLATAGELRPSEAAGLAATTMPPAETAVGSADGDSSEMTPGGVAI